MMASLARAPMLTHGFNQEVVGCFFQDDKVFLIYLHIVYSWSEIRYIQTFKCMLICCRQ